MRILAVLVAVSLLVGCATRGVAPKDGIRNFGKVNDSLYRGGQPDLRAMQRLKEMGIRSVINLRMTNALWKGESAAASASSMVYTNIPLHAFSAPNRAEVACALAAIAAMPKPVFVHCQYGCERTGTIIACFRIQAEHWDNSRALEEAKAYGLSPLGFMFRKYIQSFETR